MNYVQENEEKIIARGDYSHYKVNVENLTEYGCQNFVVVNGEKMTVQEFKNSKGGKY